MILTLTMLQLVSLSFSYAGAPLLDGISLQIHRGQRIGLIGPNGCGKSTLLKLMAGDLTPDHGHVVRATGCRLAYLHQSQTFSNHGTVWDSLLESFADVLKLRAQMQELEPQLGDHPELLMQYAEIQTEYEHRQGYTIESRAEALATQLGMKDLGRSLQSLSGGERNRLELAKVMLAQPDLLLLDEPTNHLDSMAVEALESYLSNWQGSFVVVSHDRYFLQAIANQIVEVERKGVVSYPYGYNRYVIEKQNRLEQWEAAYKLQQEEIAETEDFIRRNLAGQNTKQAKSRRTLLERLERIEAPITSSKRGPTLSFAKTHPGAKEVVTFDKVAIGYQKDSPLITSVSKIIYRGERIGIVGPNGAGKSTLIKTILQKNSYLHGTLTIGEGVHIGYFDQNLAGLNNQHTVIEELASVRPDWNDQTLRSYLGRFQFGENHIKTKIQGLSGGEKNRLSLAKMLLLPNNFLILDEPTNHLDVITCETLEQALKEFTGTVLIVSHDRYFLDQVVTQIWEVDPETKSIYDSLGNYTDWKAQKKANQSAVVATESAEKQQRISEREAKKNQERELEKRRKLMTQIEQKIAQTEALIKKLQAQMLETQKSWNELQELGQEQQRQEAELERLLAQWGQL